MKAFAIISIFILAALCIFFGDGYFSLWKIQKMTYECNRLKLGMTRGEVDDALGAPKQTFDRSNSGKLVNICNYDIPAGSSDPLSCEFDPETDVAIAIQCLDQRRIRFDFGFLSRVKYDSLRVIHRALLAINKGITADSVTKLLGEEHEVCVCLDSVLWRFPREWLGFQQPVITFDRDSMIVRTVDVGAREFVVR
jgi:hypothetical protein